MDNAMKATMDTAMDTSIITSMDTTMAVAVDNAMDANMDTEITDKSLEGYMSFKIWIFLVRLTTSIPGGYAKLPKEALISGTTRAESTNSCKS
jgi:hypothetical protein